MAMPVLAPLGVRSEANGNGHPPSTSGFWTLTIGSVGVVYGDIGTSPLYAFREAAKAAAPGGAITQNEVFGVLSLIFWALTIIVTLKYVLFLLRADNHGEGGTLALMALAQRAVKAPALIILLGIVAAALFYGDAVITPALSVLSAVEGLEVVAPSLDTWVLPLSLAILILLFLAQSRGTATVSAFFGPITVVWFIVIGGLGLVQIAGNPSVLLALSPTYAVGFLAGHGVIGLVTLGAVFLAVTGAEALYADLGHFGRLPIQTAWLTLVLPALVLNYFGQGAMVLANPATLENPFFLMAPQWAQLPMVVLATAATVIASQAVITGAYSLSRQAIQLGLLPRLEIRHTSGSQAGQIYMPRVNALLLCFVLLLVGGARQRLRHRRHRHDGGHRDPRLHGRLESVELALVHRCRPCPPVPPHRPDVPLGQPVEGHRRRLVPAPPRRHAHPADDDLAPRQPDSLRQDPAHRSPAPRPRPQS